MKEKIARSNLLAIELTKKDVTKALGWPIWTGINIIPKIIMPWDNCFQHVRFYEIIWLKSEGENFSDLGEIT
ncbi:CLUMA_CG007495, isoform A [Clunio marinus]|uniref:CLUMA_CG007495, isoform A n=1 Tax=Clunio marinus TaxID=568069 RepID=A0A1J1I6E1_9DIPT|nr:CLUMA_CG007495, isoform A [Clunio marinus]